MSIGSRSVCRPCLKQVWLLTCPDGFAGRYSDPPLDAVNTNQVGVHSGSVVPLSGISAAGYTAVILPDAISGGMLFCLLLTYLSARLTLCSYLEFIR